MSADRIDPLVTAAFAALRADPIPPLPLEAFLASLTLNSAVATEKPQGPPDPPKPAPEPSGALTATSTGHAGETYSPPWGLHRTPELEDPIDIFHSALFVEYDHGPQFRWTDQPEPMCTDDDMLLGCAADQMAFVALDRADEVITLLTKIRADYPREP